jgi:hypothetical protein
MNSMQETRPWFRQFWPWFLIALPGAVVIASLLTVYIAVTHQDPVVDGNYYKHGLTINERLEDKLPAAQSGSPAQQDQQP